MPGKEPYSKRQKEIEYLNMLYESVCKYYGRTYIRDRRDFNGLPPQILNVVIPAIRNMSYKSRLLALRYFDVWL